MKKLPILLILMLLPIVLLSVWMNTLKEEVIPLEQRGTLSLDDPASMKAAQIEELNLEQPSIVLLGNSMLGRGVNHMLLQQLMKRRISKFAIGGTSSTWWYLVTKNVVVKANPKPKVLVLFFRDHFLTDPNYLLTSATRLLNEYYFEGEEPLVQELNYNAGSVVYQQLPIYVKKHLVNKKITETLKKTTSKLTHSKSKRLEDALDKSFDETQMIEEIITAQQLEAAKARKQELFDFNDQVNRSYLPHIIQLTQENGIQLILVRTKRRRDVLGQAQPPELLQYIEDLRAYLKKNKIPLLDYTNDNRLTLKMYAEGDHLSESGMNEFTKNSFAVDLENLLKDLN
ncbi:MAG: hypothetical protein R3E32_11200 [Chitinophagales bacterium]